MRSDFIIWGTPVSHQTKRRQSIEKWQERVASAARDAIPEEDKIIHSDFSLLLIIFHADEPPADLDNLAKSTLDGLSAVAFGDDRQIAQLILRRTRLEPALSLETASRALAEALPQAVDEARDFVYVRLDPPPNHRRLP